MREFKFRVWDGLKEEMNFEGVNFSHNKNDCAVMHGGYSMYEEVWEEEDFVNNPGLDKLYKVGDLIFPVMQYTGLKDKNGKEIYEGDIIKIFYDGSVESEIICTIEFGEHSFGYDSDYAYTGECYGYWAKPVKESKRDYVMGDYFDMTLSKQIEVIGNKYENPELITN